MWITLPFLPYSTFSCGVNIDLVLSKLEKDAFTVFTSFRNKYLKANSRKSHLLTRSGNVLHMHVGGIKLKNYKIVKLKNY